MNFLRLLLIATVAACGLQYWHHHHHSMDASASVMPISDDNGFVHMPPVEGQKPDTVYVFVGHHCPLAARERALRLAQDLSDDGIPVVNTHGVTFVPVGLVALNDSGVTRVTAIMNARSAIVFVHGKAKVAATLEDVEAELKNPAR
jgi:hypothetical protein